MRTTTSGGSHGQLDKALAHAEEAVRRSPAWGVARLNLAWAVHRCGDVDRALREYHVALLASAEIDRAFAYAKRAELLEAKGCLCNALAALRSARSLSAGANADHYRAEATRLELALADRGIPFPADNVQEPDSWLERCRVELTRLE